MFVDEQLENMDNSLAAYCQYTATNPYDLYHEIYKQCLTYFCRHQIFVNIHIPCNVIEITDLSDDLMRVTYASRE